MSVPCCFLSIMLSCSSSQQHSRSARQICSVQGGEGQGSTVNASEAQNTGQGLNLQSTHLLPTHERTAPSLQPVCLHLHQGQRQDLPPLISVGLVRGLAQPGGQYCVENEPRAPRPEGAMVPVQGSIRHCLLMRPAPAQRFWAGQVLRSHAVLLVTQPGPKFRHCLRHCLLFPRER
jgi:hypothetical protein